MTLVGRQQPRHWVDDHGSRPSELTLAASHWETRPCRVRARLVSGPTVRCIRHRRRAPWHSHLHSLRWDDSGRGRTTANPGDLPLASAPSPRIPICGCAGSLDSRTAGGCGCRLTSTPRSRRPRSRRRLRRSSRGRKGPSKWRMRTELSAKSHRIDVGDFLGTCW
jgi:hypothetical protein